MLDIFGGGANQQKAIEQGRKQTGASAVDRLSIKAQRQISALKRENIALKERIKQLESDLQRGYILSPISEIIEPKESDDEDIDGPKLKHSDSALYKKYRRKMQSWNKLTAKLAKIVPISEEGDDDEKQRMTLQESLTVDKLLLSMAESRKLMEEQEGRLDEINNTDYLKELTAHQFRLYVK